MALEGLWFEEASAPVIGQTSLSQTVLSPACNTGMKSRGTTACRLCRTMDQGSWYSRTVPILMLPESCRMNSRSETSTLCPGHPFPLICDLLNMSGTSTTARTAPTADCTRSSSNNRPGMAEHPTGVTPYLIHEGQTSSRDRRTWWPHMVLNLVIFEMTPF